MTVIVTAISETLETPEIRSEMIEITGETEIMTGVGDWHHPQPGEGAHRHHLESQETPVTFPQERLSSFVEGETQKMALHLVALLHLITPRVEDPHSVMAVQAFVGAEEMIGCSVPVEGGLDCHQTIGRELVSQVVRKRGGGRTLIEIENIGGEKTEPK
jgi:hypothetical protein